ncbi:MAG: rod shape-determining protein MreC [Cyanobacteria bacterium P01_G01_bin.39]
MSRWWDKHGFQTILIVVALIIALWVKQTQGAFFDEVYYYLVSPLQSQSQLALEDRLTNARILELEQRLTELEQQNQQLKQLLDFGKQQSLSTITAPIIGRNRDRWWDKVTLGKGQQEGIEPGYIVMGIGGLVGRVIQVTPHTSKVLLITDTTSKVGTILSRNRQLGYIEGQGTSTVVMHFFSQVTDIKPGDDLLTSSLSKLYPPGLPIGKVKSTANDNTVNAAVEVEVELTAPIEILEWVAVQSFDPKLK